MSSGPANWYPPPEVVATFPKPNWVNPDSRRTLMLAFEIPLIVITLVVVLLRMISRGFITRSLGLDDWLMFVAMIFAVALMVVAGVSTEYGWGYHIYDFQPQWLVPARKLAYATEILFISVTTITKISIITFYLRVFSDKGFRRLCYLGMLCTGLLGGACLIAILAQCQPLRSYWDIHTPGKCFNNLMAMTITGALNSLGDLFVFLLPMRQVWGIQLPKKQRMSLVVIFGLGVIVLLAGLVRMYYVKVTFHDSYDFTWVGAPLYIATAIECDLSILCSSIPALKPLAIRFFPQLGSSNGSVKHSMISNPIAMSSRTNPRSRHQRVDSLEELTIEEQTSITRKVEVELSYSSVSDMDIPPKRLDHV